MTRTPLALASVALIGLAACPDSVDATTNYCPTPWGIGPTYTQGVCAPSFLCVPNTFVTCEANDCCHAFCTIAADCSDDAPCVSLTPDEIPAFVIGGGETCACDDAGPCICADGGAPCYRSACLSVCGN
jgi:hypothetical protein